MLYGTASDRALPRPACLQVPGALKLTDEVIDENDSLASLPGLQRQLTRVLRTLGNPLTVDIQGIKPLIKRAKGIVMIAHVRGGILLSGGVGSGILLRRRADDTWSGPVAFSSLNVAIGVQMGVRKTDTVMLLMNEHSVNAFARAIDGYGQIKLGTSIGLAAGPWGREQTLDARFGEGGFTACVAFSPSQGAYYGVSFEGETITGRQADNEEYYYTDGITANDVCCARVDPLPPRRQHTLTHPLPSSTAVH